MIPKGTEALSPEAGPVPAFREGRLTGPGPPPIVRASFRRAQTISGCAMKIRNSLKSAKARDKNCRVVRRRGRVYVINKKNPRMKTRQG